MAKTSWPVATCAKKTLRRAPLSTLLDRLVDRAGASVYVAANRPQIGTQVMDAKQAAANALMNALEEWAKSLGDAGVTRSDGARYFPSRQVDRMMRRAHAEGRLFEALTGWLPTYRGLRTSREGEAYANRMRDIV